MGVVDLTTNSATYIDDISPWLPRGGVAGIAQSGSVTDAFIHSGTRIGFRRIVGSDAEVVLDECDYVAVRATNPRRVVHVERRPIARGERDDVHAAHPKMSPGVGARPERPERLLGGGHVGGPGSSGTV